MYRYIPFLLKLHTTYHYPTPLLISVYLIIDQQTSLVTQLVQNLPATQETLVRFLGFGRAPGEGIGYPLHYSWASLVAQKLKNLPALQEACV